MGFGPKYGYSIISVIVALLPVLCVSQDFTCSRATYYGSPDCLGTPTGACGFGEYGRTVYDANVAGVSRLWRNGAGCGACYQVKCTAPQLCSDDGVRIVVTDYGEGDKTDFILSPSAYARMARGPNAAEQLFKYGVVEVDFRRIPCRHPYSFRFWVKEHSKLPEYLAIVPYYLPGLCDILDIEIWVGEWRYMRRAYGTVFDIAPAPKGPISLRLHVDCGYGPRSVEAPNVIPDDWKAGATYDTSLQLE